MHIIKNSKQSIRLPLYISAAIAIGVFLGAQTSGSSDTNNNVSQKANKLRQVLTYIENDYVDEVEADDLVDDAIENMLSNLDPHSNYFTREDFAHSQSQLDGNFEGIGIEFNIFKDTIHVVAPLSGGPSEKLGIQSGDKIITVDGENVAGIGITQQGVVSTLRGPKGSTVKVGIQRKGFKELLDFEIIRDVIPEFSVDVSYMIDQNTGYIKVSRFAATTYMEFVAALDDLQSQGMNQLILDLTGNTGGYLGPAVEIVDEFLVKDKMIVYTKGKEARYNEKHVSSDKGNFKEGTLIILIDEGSASASEIVSGAIQDHDRGLIVGRRSFGKGLVQLQFYLNDGAGLRLTISRYYTPSGRCIQKPYDGDLSEYYHESMDRFTNGEVFIKDSIKVNDSLMFQTANGRPVYGGGGITPDHFVPLDTIGNNAYLNKMFTTNTIREYAMSYSQVNKEALLKMKLNQFVSEFEITENMLNGLLALAETNGLPFNKGAYQSSKEQIKLYTKAFIGRGIWDNPGFYPVINSQNEIYVKAMSLFNEANELLAN